MPTRHPAARSPQLAALFSPAARRPQLAALFSPAARSPQLAALFSPAARSPQLAALFAVAVIAACTPAQPVPATTPAPAQTDSTRSLQLPTSIRWFRLAAERRALYLQSYRVATRNLEQYAQSAPPNAWAVVLDADETVLDNSAHELELARAGATYNEANWSEWVNRAAADSLPGAAAFIARARQLGGRVVIVTNRALPLCDATRENFRRLAIAVDAVLCGSGDKNPRFRSVAAGVNGLPPLEVIMFVGDNIQDFPGTTQRQMRAAGNAAYAEFGNRWVILPNPMYGSWDRIPVP